MSVLFCFWPLPCFHSKLDRKLAVITPLTWDGKSTEAHREDQEGNGNTFCVREPHYQQEGGLHSESWNNHKMHPQKSSWQE